MKYLRWVSLGVGMLVVLSLVYQLVFMTVVKPLEVNRALHSGCKTFEHLVAKTTLTQSEQANLAGEFTRASWLDSKYLGLAQASVMAFWSTTTTNLGTLQTNENYKAKAMLYGFCIFDQ